MSSRTIYAVLLFMTLTTRAHAKLEAHEWGTFTSLVGSNGITQPGMYHEDEALPSFVHQFGEVVNTPPLLVQFPRQDCDPGDKACFPRRHLVSSNITQKMETPVIYFYSDTAQRVEVNVKFPRGVVTETYPGPVRTSPTSPNSPIANGDTTFVVNVTTQKTNAAMPAVEAANIYSHARNVDSNIVFGGNGEVEKFIFYRGLGQYQPKLQITSREGGLRLSALPSAAFLVHVDASGEARVMRLEGKIGAPVNLSGKTVNVLMNHAAPTDSAIVSGTVGHGQMVTALHGAGLNADEAEAMINTWENGYLRVPGLRLLYILPRSEVDEVLPLNITPAPEKLVRVFVARIEVMLDLDEHKIIKDVFEAKNYFPRTRLGRFAEPMLRRAQEVARAEGNTTVVNELKRLIEQVSTGVETSAAIH